MEFNSFLFAGFLVTVFCLYWVLPHKKQNILLLLSSYFFYGCWDWRFLSLIWVSTAVDYYCAKRMDGQNKQKKKVYLLISLIVNLSILGTFKYANFFASSLQDFAHLLGFQFDNITLHILLPIGISFYTFQTLSYTIDAYLGKLKPSQNFIDFAIYVSFFPQLVAGPIERAPHFIPQVSRPRVFDWGQFNEGCWLIFWGLYKKVFIADNCAKLVNHTFGPDLATMSGERVLIGTYAFAWQIYCDFSGYSDIARGTAKILGFELMLNFNCPYFSVNLTDFWKRWHISLSSWLNDYLYVPLSLSLRNLGVYSVIIAAFITFFLSGLWHGAGWQYIFWGLIHGFGIVILELTKKRRKKIRKKVPHHLYRFIAIFATFHYVCLSYVFWRAHSVSHGFEILGQIFSTFQWSGKLFSEGFSLVGWIALLLIIQSFQHFKKNMSPVLNWHWAVRALIYYLILFSIVRFGIFDGEQFIYFQF